MPFRSLMLTGEQIRAARALARIEQAELARRSSLSLETIKRLERIRGPVDANVRTLNAIFAAFEAIGVFFEGSADGGVGVCRPAVGGHGLRPPPATLVAPARRTDERPAPALQRLIYASAATPETAADMAGVLDDILQAGRACNAALGVTGALLVCDGWFLQLLEGPKESVRQVYGAVSSDRRHTDLRLIENRPAAVRQFGDWSLCCGVFRPDDEAFAGEPAMRDGFRPETLTPASSLGLLSILRDLQHGAGAGGLDSARPAA